MFVLRKKGNSVDGQRIHYKDGNSFLHVRFYLSPGGLHLVDVPSEVEENDVKCESVESDGLKLLRLNIALDGLDDIGYADTCDAEICRGTIRQFCVLYRAGICSSTDAT